MGASQKYSVPVDSSDSDSDPGGAGQEGGLVFRPGRAARVSLVLTAVISLVCVGAVVGGGMFLAADMSGGETILLGFTALGWMCVTVSSGVTVFARSLPPQETWMWSQTSCIVSFFCIQWAGCFALTAALAWDVFYPVWMSTNVRSQDQHLAGAVFIVQFLGLVVALASTAFVSFDLKSHVYVALLITREYDAAVVRFTAPTRTPPSTFEKVPYGYGPQPPAPAGYAPYGYPPPPSSPGLPSAAAPSQRYGPGANALNVNAAPGPNSVAGMPPMPPRPKPSSQGLAGMPNGWIGKGAPANAFTPVSDMSSIELAQGHHHKTEEQRKRREHRDREKKRREKMHAAKQNRRTRKEVASNRVNLSQQANMTSQNMNFATS